MNTRGQAGGPPTGLGVALAISCPTVSAYAIMLACTKGRRLVGASTLIADVRYYHRPRRALGPAYSFTQHILEGAASLRWLLSPLNAGMVGWR
jgi:hypothetical protein